MRELTVGVYMQLAHPITIFMSRHCDLKVAMAVVVMEVFATAVAYIMIIIITENFDNKAPPLHFRLLFRLRSHI